MKKTLIILMSIISLSVNAQNVDLHLKKAGTGISVGGGLVLIGSAIGILQQSIKEPDYADYNDAMKYKYALDGYNREQQGLKNASLACYALSGVCFIISGTQLMKFKAGNKATAYVMPNGIGLRF